MILILAPTSRFCTSGFIIIRSMSREVMAALPYSVNVCYVSFAQREIISARLLILFLNILTNALLPVSQGGSRTGFFRATCFGRFTRSVSHVEFVSINLVSNSIANHVRSGSAQSVLVLVAIQAIKLPTAHLWGPCRQLLKRLRWCRMHSTSRNFDLAPASLYAISPLTIPR